MRRTRNRAGAPHLIPDVVGPSSASAARNSPKTDPIATWHQGGPGGSSIDVGLYTEMGYFQVGCVAFGHADLPWPAICCLRRRQPATCTV